MMAGAIRIARHGGPEELMFGAYDVPAVGPHDVRVANAFAGVNFIDIYHRTGLYPLPLPSGIGLEGAGVVEEVGESVRGITAGMRVAYANGRIGAYAEQHVLPADRVVPLPESISFETAATVMLQGITAHFLIHDCYNVGKGTRVLLHAAAGGVGGILSQWAAALGAEVIGTVGDEEKAAQARAQGCAHTILYRGEDVASRVKEITHGHGVDVVYDSVGQSTFEGSLNSLRPRGMLVSFGQASGKIPPFEPGLLAAKGSLFFTRPTMNHYVETRAELLARSAALFEALEMKKITARLSQVFSLNDAAKAHQALEGRKSRGKIILRVSG
jgi:NADPH2:quinone reductase